MQVKITAFLYLLLRLAAPADLVEKTTIVKETVQESESGKKISHRTKKIKGDWVREESESQRDDHTASAGVLYNVVTKQSFKLKDGRWTMENRGVLKEGVEEIEKRLKKEGVIPKAEDRPQFTRSTGHMSINGYECDEYISETTIRKTTAWVAPALSKYLAIHNRSHDPTFAVVSSQLPDYTKLPGIAVRIISASTVPSPPGRVPHVVTTTVDLTSITEETLPESDFAVPATSEPAR